MKQGTQTPQENISAHTRRIVAANTRFFAGSSVIFAGSFVINVLNYVFTLVMSRLLNVEDFGEVAALLSLFLIISVPATALTMLMAREVAHLSEQGGGRARLLFLALGRHSAVGAILLWVVVLSLVPFLSGYLRIPPLPLYIFSALIPLTMLGALQSGALQGLQEFLSLAKQGILGTIVKLAASVAFVAAGFSVAGVMGALTLASACGLAYGYAQAHSKLSAARTLEGVAESSFDISAFVAPFGNILLTVFLLALLSNVDVVLAKHYLPAAAAGEYAALSTVGKILIYGVGAFISVLLPMAAAAAARGNGGERRILRLSLAGVAAVSLGAFTLFSLFPHLVVSLLFGGRYAGIAEHLGAFTVAMACIALATTFINYFVATRNTSFVYLLGVGIATEVALIVIRHESPGAITQMLVYSSALLLLLMAANYAVVERAPRAVRESTQAV